MEYKKRIEDYIGTMGMEDIIFISSLYSEQFSDVSDQAFFKTVERLAKEGCLIRISKGIYGKPGQTVQQTENAVLNYFFGENNDAGMYIGNQLYQKYDLTSVVSDEKELYSNRMQQERKVIGNITIRKAAVELNYANAKLIEVLEILEHFGEIKKLNRQKVVWFARQAASAYEEKSVRNVLNGMKYKKSTIAFFKYILDALEIPNSLSDYLNAASRYKIPKIQL